MEQALTRFDHATTGEEATRALCYEGLHYRNDYYRDSFPVYQRMVNLAFHHGCQDILELGAGPSTVLWARYAQRTGASVTTIDADFAPTRSYIESAEHNARIDRYVQLNQGVTINADQLSAFYTTEHESFGDIPASSIGETIEHFARTAPQPRMDRLVEAIGSTYWSLRDLFLRSGDTIQFPARLLDKLSPSGRFSKDVAFLDKHPLAQIDPGQTFDFIFFDSGEYSSCVEWLTLKSRIAVGGLAAFHDIFFPKSMKNFLPCAALLADPNWRVVLINDSTIQGLLIAQRLA